MRRFLAGLLAGLLGGLLTGFLIWGHFRRSGPDTLPDHFTEAHLERLPFDGEWFVRWGGDNETNNRAHHGRIYQNFALDLVRVAATGDRAFSGDPGKNENYLCWGQPIYAPASGVVELAIDGVADNTPGELSRDIFVGSGNCLQIRSENGFVMEFCHFQRGSIAVHQGDRVKTGDLLGHCGNSGSSTEPHLHFHIQSESGFNQGVALRPVFDALIVDGAPQKNHSPVKSERIANGADLTDSRARPSPAGSR